MDGTLRDTVDRALAWVGSVGVDAPGGAQWLDDGTASDELYSGTAGVLLACAEARAAGVDTAAVATRARGRLLHVAREPGDARATDGDGLFAGWAGVAVALRAWARVTGDDEAAAAAGRVAAAVAQRVPPADTAARCTDVISGDAGVLIALVGHPDVPAATAAVDRLADRLVAAAETTPVGPQWRMTPATERLMPGFSHGTAGVAYALLAAGVRRGRPELVALAVGAADTLLALGRTGRGWALPLEIPARPDRPAVNYGWCHGPAGTVKLFAALAVAVPDPRWDAAVAACLRAVADSGLPERRYPGFWDNVARCCGTAGVGQALLDAPAQPDLDRVGALADDVVARTVVQDTGVAWSNTEHTATPPDLPPQPGLMQGAAGIASWLTRLAARREGRPAPVLADVDGAAWL